MAIFNLLYMEITCKQHYVPWPRLLLTINRKLHTVHVVHVEEMYSKSSRAYLCISWASCNIDEIQRHGLLQGFSDVMPNDMGLVAARSRYSAG